VVTRALLQRPEHQGPPITTPSALADAIAVVAPPVPLPEPAPRSYDGYNSGTYNSGNYGNRGGYNDGYGEDFGGGYPSQGGGMRPTGATRQSSGFTGEGYGGANPNDPSTWNTGRGGGTSTYQRDYADRDRGRGRAPMSRGLVGGVVALVVVAAGAAIWGITANLGHGSSGNPQTSPTGQAAKGGGTQGGATATVLKPTGAMSFNILGSGASPENTNLTDPLTGTGAAWQTQQYQSPAAQFGDFKNGDGYLVEMGSTVKLNSVVVDFGQSGGTAQICIGSTTTSASAGQKDISTPCPQGFTPASAKQNMSGVTAFAATGGAAGSDVLIWFSSLPSSGQQSISKVTVKGSAAG
jgi:hypothetical protein